jgi:hypothetical protein
MQNNNQDEIKFHEVFFNIAALVIFTIMLVAIFAPNIPKQIEYTLSSDKKIEIKQEIGRSAYLVMIKYGCDKVIAEYIETDAWTDTWCYNQYKNLELK